MSGKGETIALLLAEGVDERASSNGLAVGAQRLVRDASGRICLESVASEEEFEHTARNTGCFRRGTPIRDPRSREVIGYEMEEVKVTRAARVGEGQRARPAVRRAAAV